MTRGTPSMGKHGNKHTHVKCPRCGKASMHKRTKICASCGYGKTSKRND
ncbi:MAG TPA: 50S ribosomal protein L37e [Candidatus Altiarchaeales archaeon]|nr:50S ribosomal protein L37e [Candidatus Altiarchaeales archaeon]